MEKAANGVRRVWNANLKKFPTFYGRIRFPRKEKRVLRGRQSQLEGETDVKIHTDEPTEIPVWNLKHTDGNKIDKKSLFSESLEENVLESRHRRKEIRTKLEAIRL